MGKKALPESDSSGSLLQLARGFFGASPLFQSLRALKPGDEQGLRIFYIFLFGIALLCASLPFSRAVVSYFIGNHHFRPKSWAAWIALQPVPKMYSFANTCWIGPAPLLEQQPLFQSENRFLRESFWVNHYPARKARFDGGREALGAGSERFIYVRSTYLGYSETTGFRVRVEPGRFLFELRGGLR